MRPQFTQFAPALDHRLDDPGGVIVFRGTTRQPTRGNEPAGDGTGWFSQLLKRLAEQRICRQGVSGARWCGWLELMAGKHEPGGGGPGTTRRPSRDGLADFQSAAAILPTSEDLAVARFRQLADTFFLPEDYADA